jgi:hypothetical protein
MMKNSAFPPGVAPSALILQPQTPTNTSPAGATGCCGGRGKTSRCYRSSSSVPPCNIFSIELLCNKRSFCHNVDTRDAAAWTPSPPAITRLCMPPLTSRARRPLPSNKHPLGTSIRFKPASLTLQQMRARATAYTAASPEPARAVRRPLPPPPPPLRPFFADRVCAVTYMSAVSIWSSKTCA